MKNTLKAAVIWTALATSPVNANWILEQETLNNVWRVWEIIQQECEYAGNNKQDCIKQGRQDWFEIGLEAIAVCRVENKTFEHLKACVNPKILEILESRFPKLLEEARKANWISI